MFFYGIKINSDRELVEDSIQEMLADVWASREQLGDVALIKPYLFTALRRRLMRELSRNSRNSQKLNSYRYEQEPQISFSREDRIIEQQQDEQTKSRLLQTLNDLTKRQREVVYLKFYEGLSYAQIAEVMHIKQQSAQNIMQQSLKVLRQKLSLFLVSGLLLLLTSFF